MKYLNKQNIVLGLLVIILYFDGCNYLKVNDSEWKLKEEIYLEKIRQSDKKINLFRDSINLINVENEVIKEHISKDSIIVWNSDRRTRDSIRAIHNPR